MNKLLALSLLFSAVLTTASAAAPAAENWENNCAKCHGADGSGNTKMGKKYKLKDYTDAAVQAGLKDENGKNRMKGFKDDLSDPEVTDLVSYIRNMKK